MSLPSLVDAKRAQKVFNPELSRDSKQELLIVVCEVDLIILGLSVNFVNFILVSNWMISQRKFKFNCQV
jgi:hypothetical protein